MRKAQNKGQDSGKRGQSGQGHGILQAGKIHDNVGHLRIVAGSANTQSVESGSRMTFRNEIIEGVERE